MIQEMFDSWHQCGAFPSLSGAAKYSSPNERRTVDLLMFKPRTSRLSLGARHQEMFKVCDRRAVDG